MRQKMTAVKLLDVVLDFLDSIVRDLDFGLNEISNHVAITEREVFDGEHAARTWWLVESTMCLSGG